MSPSSNQAASIRQRLLNRARAEGEDFQALLTRYVIERLLYRLGRSFELEAGYVFDRAEGLSTRPGAAGDGTLVREDIDVTENRVTLGIRWAPPSRASRDLTIELKSLLQ